MSKTDKPVEIKSEEKQIEAEVDKKREEETIARLAEQELLREAVQGAARVELVGPSGWIKCPLPKTNKIFLSNTIKQSVSSNRYNSRRKPDHRVFVTKRKPYTKNK